MRDPDRFVKEIAEDPDDFVLDFGDTPSPPSGSTTTIVVNGTAAADLSGHRVVTPRDDGTFEYADNTTTGVERPLFLTTGAIMTGASADVVSFGYVTEPTWSWTPGEALYLGTNGFMTQTPPTGANVMLQEVARVITPTKILFDCRVLIELAS